MSASTPRDGHTAPLLHVLADAELQLGIANARFQRVRDTVELLVRANLAHTLGLNPPDSPGAVEIIPSDALDGLTARVHFGSANTRDVYLALNDLIETSALAVTVPEHLYTSVATARSLVHLSRLAYRTFGAALQASEWLLRTGAVFRGTAPIDVLASPYATRDLATSLGAEHISASFR